VTVDVRIQQEVGALVGCQSIATHWMSSTQAALHWLSVVEPWEVPPNPWTLFVGVQHSEFNAIQNSFT